MAISVLTDHFPILTAFSYYTERGYFLLSDPKKSMRTYASQGGCVARRRREWAPNTPPTQCTGFVPGTPASVPPYLVLQGAPTHHFARTESRCTASVPPYPVLQEAPTHHFARTESRRTALVPPYAVLQRAPTHRCAQTEVTEPNSPARAALRRRVTTETMCKNSRQLPAGCSALQ